jgi:hypothetical protein
MSNACWQSGTRDDMPEHGAASGTLAPVTATLSGRCRLLQFHDNNLE